LRNRNRQPNTAERPTRTRRIPPRTLALILLVAILAAVGGIIAGNWIFRRHAAAQESARLDEYVGLAEHTGLAGELDLQVNPVSLTVPPGKPAKVMLTLTNRTTRPMTLNGWLTPAPALYQSNQLPFKVQITKNGRPVRYTGNSVLYPPHTKKDFFVLQPGQSKQIVTDLSRGTDDGKWDMSKPGVYTAEAWYETYLTGRYIGVHAWTGMTNHVIVKIIVR
jgi:hypothetical protein